MPGETVSRARYERAVKARAEAEALLEQKSRALWEANKALREQAEALEEAVRSRTEELERARAEAEAANDAKSGFLAVISHEIRTPMNAILGMAAGLEESGLPPDQQEMAQVILSSGRVLLDLLNDVLDLSKIEAGRMEMEMRPFDLRAFAAEERALFSEMAASRGLAFSVEVMADKALVVSDPTRLRQVLSNLLSNAFKFTREGAVAVLLTVRDGQLQMRVTDSGPGVPEAHRPRLFQAFSQGDASVTRTHGGTGLGLAISRRFCRLLGGDLVYEHVPGGGACFVATVALGAAPVADRRIDRAEGFKAEQVLRARRWRVLVAEDSETNQKVLRLVLKPFDLDLRMVTDGAQAVALRKTRAFDLVLMDVNMPVMDGLVAAAAIRAWEAGTGAPRVPIMALTANVMTHQVSDYATQGIDAHVGKPFRREELVQGMARLLKCPG
ncbi:ATP-binding protein [Sagittula stellata]|uniref:histidine kinase n=1 Tax=Sagittula stellata (strain ATCC 700073 / DSM 11524 / E-37) TaxID=388399 RepID=A3K8A5_SAGS3|nr:ATP-binding protein [Sagittula stellata]EBA06584.1 sensor histidine kinase/response regulator [Sagittula stellata E-37]